MVNTDPMTVMQAELARLREVERMCGRTFCGDQLRLEIAVAEAKQAITEEVACTLDRIAEALHSQAEALRHAGS